MLTNMDQWTNHISVRHYVASLATDNVNLLLKCYSRSRTSILRIVTSSVFTWICMLSLVCINISHLVSGFCPGQCHLCQANQETRSFSTLHSWHFYVSHYTVYCWCGWWRPSSNRQLWSSVLKLRLSWPVCQVSRLDRHRHIIAQAIQACLNWIK